MYQIKSTLLAAYLYFLATPFAFGQPETDLLSQLGDDPTTEHAQYAFKSSRVINSHSMEMLHKGTLDFRILHRFGEVSDGYYQLFGLDQASMRMAFDYGITRNLTAGVGRSTSKKELDGFLKYRILWQSKGKRVIPISLIWVSGVTMNGLKQPFSEPQLEVTFSRRLAYYHQVIIGRKFSEHFTLQLAPTLVHQNIVDNKLIPNDLFALELGGRYKFSKRMAVVWDYTYAFNRFPDNVTYNPFSLGLDIETGGHVFQLHFSNATGMNERAAITDANGDWLKGEVRFGFNLSRVFQIVKNKPVE